MNVRSVRLTNHAVERYRERLQRPQEFEQAKRELLRLMRCGTFCKDPPDWLRAPKRCSGYWVMGDVCLVLEERVVAVTCLTRGTISPHHRRVRNDRRRSRRYRLAKERAR